jgi:spermidine/putrescine transport system permease protein
MEAAMDLGCRRIEAFLRVFVPGIAGPAHRRAARLHPQPGILRHPRDRRRTDSELLGNKIAQRLFTDRNLPHAAGLASLLTILVVVPMVVIIFVHRRRAAALAGKGSA